MKDDDVRHFQSQSHVTRYGYQGGGGGGSSILGDPSTVQIATIISTNSTS